MVREFLDGEQPHAHDFFQRWRADHPVSFFVNCRASGGWMLHRVGCFHPGDTDWTSGKSGSLTRVRKVCSTSRRELIEWARQNAPAALKKCNDCKP